MSHPRIEPAAGNAPFVLVVDDDDDVRRVTRRILEGAGYQVREAADGLQALSLITEQGSPSVVIADIRMPNMDGWQLAAQLAQRSPPMPILFMSGYDAHFGSATLPGPFLAKPFRAETLVDRVAQLLAPPTLLHRRYS